MNVDVNYSLEDVITVGGGMEAFFDFNDDTKWYIYVGKKEPENKRIRAEVLSIITASAYFMVDPTAIQFGAAVGIDLQYEFGPVEVRLIIRLRFEIALFFKEPQLTGLIELYGEITLKICGIGLSLILQALLEGSAPQPWWIHGKARFALSLPFPLPRVDAEVEFTWGETAEPARVDLLKGASMIHPKQLSTSWQLSIDPANPTVVPVDSIALLSCGKPISMVSRKADGGLFDWETVEGFEFGYDITSVRLVEVNSDRTVLEKQTRFEEGDGNPAPGETPWFDLGRIHPVPINGVQEPQIQLWGYSPLDAVHPVARESYVDACDRVQRSAPKHCVDWRNVAVGTNYPRLFTYKRLSFAVALGTPVARVTGHRVVGESLETRGLEARTLTIRFPEPITRVEIHCFDGDAQYTAYYRGQRLPDEWSRGALPNIVADTIFAQLWGKTASAVITEICYVTQREERTVWQGSGSSGEDRTAMAERPVLRPETAYRLEVIAQRRERRVGEAQLASAPASQTASYYFKTAKAPGLNLTSEQAEEEKIKNPGVPLQLVEFRDGVLNRLETYVRRTVPRNGAKIFYRDYDVLVEFNEPYMPAIYHGALTMRLKDRNGKSVPAPDDGRDAISQSNWELLYQNPTTVDIVATNGDLYERGDDGVIRKYNGTPLTGWDILDQKPATVDVAASGGNLYQRHQDGKIWKYDGIPISGWSLLDRNPATVDIVADGNDLYQRHRDGKIWKYNGIPLRGWDLLDDNPATTDLVASRGNLYQRHSDGKIWKYNGTPLTGWDLLDRNPATVEIVADGDNLYQRHRDGKIWKYNGTPLTGWDLLDQNPATVGIVASGSNLYQRHEDGRVWKYNGTPLTGWDLLDQNGNTVGIVASGGNLYQRRRDGTVWRYNGAPIIHTILSGLCLVTPGLLSLLSAARESECAGEPKPWVQFEKQYLACSLPRSARPGRMYIVELMAEQTVLYSFQFATSRYRNIREHLESGLIEQPDAAATERRRLQELRNGLPAIPEGLVDWTSWTSTYNIHRDAIRSARERLVAALAWRGGAEHEVGVSIEQALQEMLEQTTTLHQFCAGQYVVIDRQVQTSFAAVNLGHRPLPPKVELVRIGVESGKGCFLLLESPEPLEWLRINLTYSSPSIVGQTARIVWSEDQTCAFVFAEEGLFAPSSYNFTFSCHRGGQTAPDLDPFYRNGALDPPEEAITWDVELT